MSSGGVAGLSLLIAASGSASRARVNKHAAHRICPGEEPIMTKPLLQKLTRSALLAGGSLLAVSFAAAPAIAQDEPETATEEEAAVLDRIVVTTRFREETTQDIGASVAAIGADDIANRSISDFDDIARTIAGVQNVSSGGLNSNDVAIRGLSNARGVNSGNFQTSTLFSVF